jgi:Sel1 repeat
VVRNTRALETLGSHLFCGTCETSLPHPPLTVPGAESTLSLSRWLGPPRPEHAETNETDSSISREPAGGLPEMPSPSRSDTDACPKGVASAQETGHGKSIATPDDPTKLVSTVRPQQDAAPTDALAGREFIPEISLSEYINQFRYEPPNEPQEVTMHGDAAPVKPATAIADLETPLPAKTAAAIRAPLIADVDFQVPLDFGSVGSSELPSDSSGSLVIDESLGKKADLQPSIPADLSVPGLRDSSEITEPFEAADDSGRRWQIWVAAGVVAAIAALGAARILNMQSQNTDSLIALKQPLSMDKESTAAAEMPKTRVPLGEDRNSLTGQALTGGKDSAVSVSAAAANSISASHRKATANDNPDAPVELANRYLRGKGVPRSCEKAMLLLQSAAAKANVRACNRLASMYAIGTCVPRDRIQAYRWLESALAADPHNEWALQNRDLTLHQMTAEERSRVENGWLMQ